MNIVKQVLPNAVKMFFMMTLLCGILYTGFITAGAQLLFPYQANGSLIQMNGRTYGSALIGQPYTDNGHMWGRIMQLDISTYKDVDGSPLLYAGPSNLSPAGTEFKKIVAQRVEKLRATDPDKKGTPVPVDLVTDSGSGLDPDISPAAAAYQVSRIAKARGISEIRVKNIIEKCTTGRTFGILGEPTVNVLKVNLMLDGILS